MTNLTELTGKALDKTDSSADLPFIPASAFESNGSGKTYPAVVSATSFGSINTSGGRFKLVHCAIGGKGLATILVSYDDEVVIGQKLLLTYTETVNTRARFNTIAVD